VTPRRKSPPAEIDSATLVINGWTVLVWPEFGERWIALITAVARRRVDDPGGWAKSPEARMLRALVEIIQDRIARDPNSKDYRLKDSLRAWRRAKFLGRFRLFYRFDSVTRIVILTWLNDLKSLRKEGARTDPYVVFAGLLERGEIPADWDSLKARAAIPPRRDEDSP
jgi:toxin YhaV